MQESQSSNIVIEPKATNDKAVGEPSVSSKLATIPKEADKRVQRRNFERNTRLIASFYYAIRGLRIALQRERNLKIHLVVAILVILGAIFLKLDASQFAILSLAVGLVITAELVNTALERFVDVTYGKEFNRLARDAKDIAAAAVLLASLTAIIVGFSIFGPVILAFVLTQRL